MLVGAVQARLMQSLKALTIFGTEGGPGNAGKVVKIENETLHHDSLLPIIRKALTFCPCLDVISLHHVADVIIRFRSDMVAVFSAVIHIGIPVFGLWADLPKFFPAVSANLLALQDVVSDGTPSIVLGNSPFEFNAGGGTFNNFHWAERWRGFVWSKSKKKKTNRK